MRVRGEEVLRQPEREQHPQRLVRPVGSDLAQRFPFGTPRNVTCCIPFTGCVTSPEWRGRSWRYEAPPSGIPGSKRSVGVDFTIQPAEIVGLVGKNGAGKSSLIKILAGVEQPDEGTLTVDGTPVPSGYAPHTAHRLGLSFVHQELGNFPLLTVAENVAIGTRFPRRLGVFVNDRELRRRVQAVLSQLESSIDPAAHLTHLTAVEQRLVMIARALYHDARVLVLDEPSVSLTIDEIAHLHAIVRRFKELGRSVVYVSHRLHEVVALTDRVVVMQGGEVILEQPTSAIDEQALVKAIAGDAPIRARARSTAPARDSATTAPAGHRSLAATRRQGGVLRAPRRRDPRARRARRLGTDGAGAPALRRRHADRRVDRGRRPARAPAQPGRRDRPRDRAPAGGPGGTRVSCSGSAPGRTSRSPRSPSCDATGSCRCRAARRSGRRPPR